MTLRKTVFILASYAPSLIDFRGRLIQDIIASGHRVVAAAPGCVGEQADALRHLGAEPISVELNRSDLNPVADVSYMRRLEAIFRRISPHTLIAYTIKPVIWGAIAAHRAGVPNIVPMITGLGYAFIEGAEFKRRIVRLIAARLYRAALSRSNAAIFQNPDDLHDFVRLGLIERGKASIVDGSGVDTETYPYTTLPSRPAFLMLSRLLRDKGVAEYAQAAKILRCYQPDISVRLLGATDPSPNAIRPEDIAVWGDGAVEYGGAVNDVRPALASASVFVLPSYREGTPRSTLEAMAMGRAIITTDVPGCRETVTHGDNGLLVPPRDVNALANAMRSMVENPAVISRMGVRSRELAERRYDVRKVNQDIMRIAGLD